MSLSLELSVTAANGDDLSLAYFQPGLVSLLERRNVTAAMVYGFRVDLDRCRRLGGDAAVVLPDDEARLHLSLLSLGGGRNFTADAHNDSNIIQYEREGEKKNTTKKRCSAK